MQSFPKIIAFLEITLFFEMNLLMLLDLQIMYPNF